MTLKLNSRGYEQEFESDLTKLPGWQEADVRTRERIINGAKKYIEEYSQIAYDWIGKNTLNRPALAGCRALQLLLQETPEFIDTLSSKVWQKWASVIVAFPYGSTQGEHYYTELVKWAYIVNLNSTVNGDQIGTQHNYAQEQNLTEAFEEIQQIVNRITQNYPTQTEAEKQIIIAEAVEQVKQNPTLRKRLELGGKAFIFEALQKASDQWWVAPFVKAIEAGVKGE